MNSRTKAFTTGLFIFYLVIFLSPAFAAASVSFENIDCGMQYSTCCFVGSEPLLPVNSDTVQHASMMTCISSVSAGYAVSQIPGYHIFKNNYILPVLPYALESVRLLC